MIAISLCPAYDELSGFSIIRQLYLYEISKLMSAPAEEKILTAQSDSQKADRDLSRAQVVFFDGVCGMCNQFVDFVMKHDHDRVFLFAPLQGETAKQHLDKADTEDLKSIVLMIDGQSFRHSAAVVRVLWSLPFLWKVAGYTLWLIPGPLRDVGYRLIAKVRYRLFGKKQACRLPTPEERARFLL